jgi:hypothetical protein
MTNIIAFQKPMEASISPAVRALGIAWLIAEIDAAERKLAGLKSTLAEVTGISGHERGWPL